MKNLLELKAEYKHATGKDWKPGATPTAASASQHADRVSVDLLNQQITDAGNHVRKLKAEKAGKVINTNGLGLEKPFVSGHPTDPVFSAARNSEKNELKSGISENMDLLPAAQLQYTRVLAMCTSS